MFDAGPSPDTPLMQDTAFAAALRLCGQNPLTLASGEMLLHRRILGVPVAMLPRATPPATLDAALRALGLHRTPLILSPERPCTLPRAVKLRGPQTIAVLDLHEGDATARAALHPKWRNQLRRAEGAGLRLSDAPMPADPDHILLRLEAVQARARGYANWPAPLTAAFARVAPDQTRLFTAFARGTAVARMLFLTHGGRATYHIGQTTPEGRSVCAHNLLLWHATRWLATRGYHTLDLGLIDQRTPGLNRFKRRTGTRQITTGGTWLRWRPLARGGDA